MQFLRTILIILIIYYVVRFFSREVLPFLAKYFIYRNIKDNQKKQDNSKRKTGEVNIEYTPEKKEILDKLGEYTDYEEIKD